MLLNAKKKKKTFLFLIFVETEVQSRIYISHTYLAGAEVLFKGTNFF